MNFMLKNNRRQKEEDLVVDVHVVANIQNSTFVGFLSSKYVPFFLTQTTFLFPLLFISPSHPLYVWILLRDQPRHYIMFT